ncbi:MAG: hypothetical protein JWP97_2193 [Labilithrix sp.]|nr:hypothetical protein [Labilithrix sp.]
MSAVRRPTFVFAALLVLWASPAGAQALLPPAPLPAKNEPSPAQAADPPRVFPPVVAGAAGGEGGPVSFSGTDVMPAAGASAGPAGEAHAEAGLRASLENARARIASLEQDLGPLRHLKVQGYVQLQYRLQSFDAAASPNGGGSGLPRGIGANDVVARGDGSTTNTNLFRLRRTRLRTVYDTDVLRVTLEAELLPAGGPTATDQTLARNAEVTGIARFTPDVRTELTGGLFQVPFLAEVLESSMTRPFIERTFMSQSLFPSERDLGLHAKTFVRDLVSVDVGIVNGRRLGEPGFAALPDLDTSKDFFAMAELRKGPIEASLSGYAGRGQLVDTRALRVKNYGRMATNVAARVHHVFVPSLGETRLGAELMFGRNMDTGALTPFALPVIPASFSADVRDVNERGFSLRAEQELTRWALAGARFDTYTTDSSIDENGRDAYVLMAGVRFTRWLRLVNEVSYVIDNLHPAAAPAPSRHTFGYTAWLQGSFF